ncbi:hypothetical protein GGX14DRAFT_694696 [Mycena pura]|uniref:DNA 3'-5' helicase n=1 Tax=Mycena pura TaxID=153505 RepID=A0AAD6VX79_9AGAR|nr:hypothetical protein GGX14DRAFT_694696 [Mycena pura]
MPDFVSWHSIEGAATVKAIVKARIPAWKDGLHLQQEEPILRILDGQDVLLCTATGAGKSAPLTALPVGLIITPAKALARSIVDLLATHDVSESALAYDRETLLRAAHEHRNLIEDIASCTLFHVICVDPEHLHSTPWQRILDTPVCRENLIYACLEEGHLANEWLTFREAYRNIGTFLRGRLPSHTSVFSNSATLEPGAPTTALYKTLGFRAGNFKEFRFSNERQDLQFILETLKHKIFGRSFPQLLPYLNTGRKAVIYALSLDIVTRIYTYLFRALIMAVVFGSTPHFLVVATVALANGIHCSSIDNSLSIGMPSTLSQMEQQAGAR